MWCLYKRIQILLLISIWSTSIGNIYAQNDTLKPGESIVYKTAEKTAAKNSIFAELFGNAGKGLYSVNYERTFLENSAGFLKMRVGISKLDRYISIPILVNQVFGKKRHHFECGAGVITESYFYTSKTFDYRLSLFGVTGNFMYRYQKIDGKFLFRVGYTPILYSDFRQNIYSNIFYLLFFGVGLGYAF